MKIAEIDVIPIRPRLAARYAGREVWYPGINHRTVYRVRADNGLVGYGDHRLQGEQYVDGETERAQSGQPDAARRHAAQCRARQSAKSSVAGRGPTRLMSPRSTDQSSGQRSSAP